MPAINPTPWQARVLRLPETLNLALLGGRGGGKTTCALLLALRHCIQYGADARVLVIRSTFKSLQNLYDDADDLFAAAFPSGVSSNRADFTFRLPNGAVVMLGNLDGQRDYRKYQGQSYTLLVVDEITNFATLRHVNLLRANLRGPRHVPLRMVILGNPGGPMHATISRMHVQPRVPWLPYTLDDGTDWIYAPSTFRENPHLDQDQYARQIAAAAGGDRALSEAWLNNDWAEIAGAFFADVWGPHLLIPNDPTWRVPRGPSSATGWRSCVSLDWGWSAPAVALLCVMPIWPQMAGPGGRAFPVKSFIVLDEVHTACPDDPAQGKGWPPQMLAEEILAACSRRNVSPFGVGDDARGLEGDGLLDQFRRHGLYLSRPRKDRISGWVRLKSLMLAAKAESADLPGLFVSEACRLTCETVPLLPRDETRREDVDTSANDHAADALRYLVFSEEALWPVMSGRVVGIL